MSSFKYVINGNTYEVTVGRIEGSKVQVTVNGVMHEVEVQREVPEPPKIERPKVVTGAGPQPSRMVPVAAMGDIRSPLPGVILSVKVKEGDEVKQGDCVCILEAMKMENEIYAPSDGKVTKVNVTAGQSVLEGDVLVAIGV